jgi:hypothetical protein
MQEFLEQRSLEQVLADLRASYQRRPGPALAKMIQKVEAEIAFGTRPAKTTKPASVPACESDPQPNGSAKS